MRAEFDCAPAGCTVEARGITKSSDTQSAPYPIADAQAGKALTVWLYNIGARSLQDTQAAFERHPEWAPA